MSPPSRLLLGTAQWGMAYGVANRSGPPSEAEIVEMLRLAAAAGVDTLDTAGAYGSEPLIGALAPGWTVMTKLAGPAPGDGRPAAVRAREGLAASRVALGREVLDAVLLHDAEDRRREGGAAWQVVRAERADGLVRAAGVSAATPQEALDALGDPEVEVVQVAASVLDRRLESVGFFHAARARGLRVVVRSVFLQGSLLLPAAAVPIHLAPVRDAARRLADVATTAGTSLAALALAYVRDRLGADVVVGAERPAQVAANLEAWRSLVEAEVLVAAAEVVGDLPDEVLDPWRWPA